MNDNYEEDDGLFVFYSVVNYVVLIFDGLECCGISDKKGA